MCKSPTRLEDGTEVACRLCSLCRDRAINDWVGRNVAESKTAKDSHAVTLTYGRNSADDIDHERAAILTYSDVQKYIKLLRRHGYPVRYFVTGEFGSKKGRAHWHVMLYWQDKVPPHVLGRVFLQEHWPHGWSHWTRPTPHAIRYNCKYVQKDMGDDERQGHLAMSKKPPLGAEYFAQRAEQYVKQGLAPQDLFYTFPDVRRKKRNGSQEIVPFMLKGRSAELFLEHYVRTWQKTYPGRHMPESELVEEYLDKMCDFDPKQGLFEQRVEAMADRVVKTPIWDIYGWGYQWMREAENEQERQKRQREFARIIADEYGTAADYVKANWPGEKFHPQLYAGGSGP